MARPITKLRDIEAAALELFASSGAAQVTIKEIASQAGCAEGALYRHYASKEDMAWALFKREVERFSSQLRKALARDSDFAKRIDRGVRLFYSFFDKNPAVFSFVLLAQHNFPVEKKLDPKLNPHNVVSEFVSEGIRNKQIKMGDARLATALILGLVLQPATLRAVGWLTGPLGRRAAQVSRACAKVLELGRPSRRRN